MLCLRCYCGKKSAIVLRGQYEGLELHNRKDDSDDSHLCLGRGRNLLFLIEVGLEGESLGD